MAIRNRDFSVATQRKHLDEAIQLLSLVLLRDEALTAEGHGLMTVGDHRKVRQAVEALLTIEIS